MTMGSLFAGIGGFDLGFERAGFQTVWQVEINEWARKVLAKNFPHAERYADIRECGRHNLKPVDVICGGFPCQDISNAGLRAGIEGERSGLWSEFARVINELQPKYVLIENVAALLSGKSPLNRVRPGRCVCGWSHRRRRVHLRSAVREQRARILHASGRSGDECAGESGPSMAGGYLRRINQEGSVANGIECGVNSLVSYRSEGGGDLSPCTSTPTGEETSGGTCDAALELHRFLAETCGRVYGVDGGIEAHVSRLLGFEQGIESTWSGEQINGRTGWLECAACRRPVGDLSTNYVLAPWFGTLQRDLASIGYDAEWEVVSAADVGAPHLRERVWILAYPMQCGGGAEYGQQQEEWAAIADSSSAGDVAHAVSQRHCGSQAVSYAGAHKKWDDSAYQQGGNAVAGEAVAGCEAMADAASERCGEARGFRRVQPAQWTTGGGEEVPNSYGGDVQGLFGGSDDTNLGQEPRERPVGLRSGGRSNSQWEIEPNVGRVAHGVPARVDRLRGLGNAVVPQIPELYAHRLAALLANGEAA